MTIVRRLSWWDRFVWSLRGWPSFPLPYGEFVDCHKDRRRVEGTLVEVNWGPMAAQVIGAQDTHRVNRQGVGSGTPAQLGRPETRSLTYGGGYGKHEQHRTRIPLPVLANYWLSGYPSPAFDKRCIISSPDGSVCEMNHLDPFLGELPPGFPQQALGFGRFINGQVVEGEPSTATGLPVSSYLWGPNSAYTPHAQALVLSDYVGADGLLSDGPLAGDWFALDPDSVSYAAMVALGGECAYRAVSLELFGARLIDRSGYADAPPDRVGTVLRPPKLHTQAGAWTAGTNAHLFRVDLNDLRRVVG